MIEKILKIRKSFLLKIIFLQKYSLNTTSIGVMRDGNKQIKPKI